jgi:hypothetical protein
MTKLEEYIYCSCNHAYNEDMDKAKHSAWQKIQSLEEMII